MPANASRRRFLGVLGAGLAAGSAGCLGFFSGAEGDVLVENQGAERRIVTVILDRGSSYRPTLESAIVQGDSEHLFEGFLGSSDYPFPFLLHLYVDGEYRKTTKHTWESGRATTVTIRDDGTVVATETTEPVDITPQVRNQTTGY